MATVTYNVKWQDDTDANSGTSTLIWNKIADPFPSDSTRTSTNGILTVDLEQGVLYEINVLHDGSIDAASGIEYVFFRGDADEQRSRDDTTSPMSFNANAAVTAYKLISTYPVIALQTHASIKGVNIGIRRPANNMIMWLNTNFTMPDATRKAWLQSLATVLGDTYQEGTSTPTSPYIDVAFGFPSPTNASIYGSDHIITLGSAQYTSSPPAGVLWIEYLQARWDLEDSAGTDPPMVSIDGSGNPFLNTFGVHMVNVLDNLVKVDPKTKF